MADLRGCSAVTIPDSWGTSQSDATSGHPLKAEQVTLSKRTSIELRARTHSYQRHYAKALNRTK